MNKKEKKLALRRAERIVPELRFPEFENEEGWVKKELKQILKSYKLGGNYRNNTNKTLKPLIKMGNIGRGKIILDKIQYILETEIVDDDDKISKGDLFLNTRNTLDLVGKVAIWNNELPLAYYNSNLMRIEFDNNCFMNFRFNSNEGIKKLKKIATGTTSVAAIYTKDLLKLSFFMPKNSKEQKKIANCLSSLDDLITAETEKLELLQDHKKGLLQKLFPTKGETKPKYRFPEFKNNGDWIKTTLNEVADYENGKAHEKEISETGKYKVVNSKFISTEGEVVKYSNSANLKANIGDILMVLSDIPNGKAIAKCFYVDADDTYTVNQRICKITPTNIDNKFLFYTQNRNKYFLAFDDGVKQTNLRKDTVLSFPFLKPKDPKEQQKIANCLTKIDDLVTTQTLKIEGLQQHKRGLMQKLFPNVNN